jgi:hypothetical protein
MVTNSLQIKRHKVVFYLKRETVDEVWQTFVAFSSSNACYVVVISMRAIFIGLTGKEMSVKFFKIN